MREFVPIVVAAFGVITGCKTETEVSDFNRAEQRILKAIADSQYEEADRLINEAESEAAGGVGCDRRNLRWALVKVRLGQYSEASNLVEQILFDYPESPSRDTALKFRKWLAEKQESTHNQASEPSGDTAPQVQR